MNQLDAFRLALAQLGDALPEFVAEYINQKFGMKIAAKYLPFYKASLLDLQDLDRRRQDRSNTTPTTENDQASPSARKHGSNKNLSPRAAETHDLAIELLARHSLNDWSFAYNRRKQAMGLCIFQKRRIELSIHFVESNDQAEILDTILHEIAHALVGPGHGHDKHWKKKCLEVGAKPLRCGDAIMPEGNWVADCLSCGKQYRRHRQPKRRKGWYCLACGLEQGQLIWRNEPPAA